MTFLYKARFYKNDFFLSIIVFSTDLTQKWDWRYCCIITHDPSHDTSCFFFKVYIELLSHTVPIRDSRLIFNFSRITFFRKTKKIANKKNNFFKKTNQQYLEERENIIFPSLRPLNL